MKSFKLTTLYTAMLCAGLVPVYSAASMTDFMNDTDVNLGLRTVFIIDKTINKNGKPVTIDDGLDWQEGVQGFNLELLSGYLYDMVGVDFGAYAAGKFYAHNPSKLYEGAHSRFSGTTYHKASDTPPWATANSYAKLGKGVLKLKAGDEDLGGHFNYGWQQLNNRFNYTSKSRATPATSQAADAAVHAFGVSLYSVHTNRLMIRTDPTIEHYETPAGARIDYIYTLGLKTEQETWELGAEFNESKNWKRQYYLGGGYTLNINKSNSLYFLAHYYRAEGMTGAGTLWKGEYFTKNADLLNLNVFYNFNNLEFGLSYSQTNAKGGIYDYCVSDNDTGSGDALTFMQESDFNNDKEKAVRIGASYSFDDLGVPGLYFSTAFVHGSGIDAVSADTAFETEYEVDTEISYEFVKGPLKGLAFSMNHSYWWTKAGYGGAKSESNHNPRFYIDYTLNFF